jgi:hypothetical protein
MSCTLTVSYFYNGAVREIVAYQVPDASYTTAYKVPRPDLYTSGQPKVYDARTTGSQGEIVLGTYYPNITDVSIVDAVISCPPPPPPPQYDCLNGACVTKTTYNTPGLYPSLGECQVACGTGCSGVCVSASDWANIEGLASRNKSQNCS